MQEIKVTVVEYADRKSLLMTYRDPNTGRLKTKSAKTTDRRAAEKAAAIWENQLRSGTYAAPDRTAWSTFRERYEAEVYLSERFSSATLYSTWSSGFSILRKSET